MLEHDYLEEHVLHDRELELTDITPVTIAAYVADMELELSARTVKQHRAAIRTLFDYFVSGGVLPSNPASGGRGPKAGPAADTQVLPHAEARRLLASIDTSEPAGLRDRAFIAVMLYGFARVPALTPVLIT